MSIIAAPAGVCASQSQSLYQVISGLGLTTNLKLCFDAGDASSYNSAVQTARWLDVSGNGYDFYRGSSTGGDTGEPTFNGTAGRLTAAEYFSFDGGDYFSYDTSIEAWMNTLHKDGAIVTVLAVFYPAVSATVQRLFATRSGSFASGFIFIVDSDDVPSLNAFNGITEQNTTNFTTPVSVNAWNVIQISFNENGGANNYIMNLNGTAETATASYPSPSASDVSAVPCIGALAGAGGNQLPNGSRLACFAVWQGTALTAANLSNIYNAIRGRFGL